MKRQGQRLAVVSITALALAILGCSQTRVVDGSNGGPSDEEDAGDPTVEEDPTALDPAADLEGMQDSTRHDGVDEAGEDTEELLDSEADPESADESASLDIRIVDQPALDTSTDGTTGPCPPEMVHIEGFCIDRYEAPNRELEVPFVMMSYYDGLAWCTARGKRLCYDDEWTRACSGPDGLTYPYGATYDAGVCNDEETWLAYDQTKLNGWPRAASASTVESYEEQIQIAHSLGGNAAIAADHVDWLYQAEPGGANLGCDSAEGVSDLCGNIEEWTRRRDGGNGPDFSGTLKGRYWAETRTCFNGVTSHGNAFRFYETGFRCCMDPY